MSVDRETRDRYAELLRHFAAGRLSNCDYEKACDALLTSGDRAIRELWWVMWHSYDDIREHRLAGRHKLPRAGRRLVARMIVFLHSDLPFEWPPPSVLPLILNVLTLGLWRLCVRRRPFGANWDLWPFFRADDLGRARSRPRLLTGGVA